MNVIGIRLGNAVNVIKTVIKNLGLTSEANQWKVHQSGTMNFTSVNQRLTVQHGLTYTPAFMVFKRVSGQAYYTWGDNANDYSDPSNFSALAPSGNGDTASYVIFKDFGA